MKLSLKTSLLTVLTITVVSYTLLEGEKNERKEYEEYLLEHPFLNRDYSEVSSMKKQDRPDLGWELDHLITMDPSTKKPERSRLLETYKQIKLLSKSRISSPGQSTSPWVERGPNNVAGRTRSVVFDPNTTNKVWAGSVGGGLWYNNDITDANSSWLSVDDFWNNLSITSIAFDPNESSTIYVGTGEGWGTGAARGEGVWKSTDSGLTWNQLAETDDFYYVNDIVVRDESNGASPGVLYVATSRNFHRGRNHGSNGVHISTDGGANFSSVTDFTPTDLSIAADNRIWSGTTNGQVWYTDDGTNWTNSHSSGFSRVAIATAPSNANFIYALIESSSVVETIIVSSDKGATWTAVTEPADVDNGIPDTDFTRGQAWYDLVIAVDPNDENTVVVGGIDLFRSSDAGQSWTQISKWSNNNNLSGLSASLVHADQHAITFRGSGSSEVLFGNDGGVFYSSNLANAGTQDVIPSRNNNYNVTQYYACAIHPEAERNFFLAGAQDNGSQRFTSPGINSTVDVNGGDGAFCFIDQTDPTYQITSYVFNVYDLSTNEGQSFSTNIQNDQNSGLFINPADYDDNQDILYSSKNENSINRISGISSTPSVGSVAVTLGNTTSHLRVSPYTTNSTTLFAGTLSGRVFKIENADSDSPNSTEITDSTFPSGSISCIEIGSDENELLVTFSNYGVTSVWYSSDGGSNWTSKEGDLPDMPVRWALFNPNNRSEVILATELGVWSTTNIGSDNPTWSPSNSGLANVRTDMLQIRTSDNEVIASTHGRGLFSSNGFQAEAAPNVDFTSNTQSGCGSSLEVTFTNLTSANPAASSYSWTFEGGNPSTSASETPPTITYDSPGTYTVTLTATNSVGEATETKTNFINLGASFSLPFEESFDSETFPPSCWNSSVGTNGLGTSNNWGRVTNNTNSGNGAAYVEYESVSGGNAEDWLITPEINLSAISSTAISFYARQSYSQEYGSEYHLKVSTTSSTDLSSFSNVYSYSESDFSATTFQEYNVDLSDYDGMNIYIAFVMEQNNGDDWYLDDVSVTGQESALTITSSNGFDFCENETSVLSVSNQANATYQWKLDNVEISGATSSAYTPTTSGSYSVVETLNNVESESNSQQVNISTLPIITTEPISASLCEEESLTFTVAANGNDLSYQWQYNGVNIDDNDKQSGTQTSILTLESVGFNEEGSYTCIISSGSCSVISNVAELTVLGIPIISAQPASVVVCNDETTKLEVTASGNNLIYQWQYNGNNIADNTEYSGSETSTLIISSIESSHEGDYTCIITSETCSITSSTAVVTVVEKPIITSQPTSQDVCTEESGSFDVIASGDNLSYQWQYNGNDVEDGSQYNGTKTATLTISSVATTDEGDYTCIITNSACSITTESAGLTTLEGTSIASQPASSDVCESETATFEVTASGTDITYQWLKDDVIISNDNGISGVNTNVLTIADVSLIDEGSYRCEILSACATQISASADLTVNNCLGLKASAIEIFPNPVSDMLHIKRKGNVTVEIYSIEGRLLSTSALSEDQKFIKVDYLKKGTYILNIRMNDELITKKVYKR
ncbi:MAG: immunoglobulin domain-containing protein [Ekhidna sp.]